MSNFCHLHCHSEYSLLDGLGRTADLAKEAARLGQPALALTDHGIMHGAIEFFRNCKKHGIKPIIGVEAYLTPFGRSRQERDPSKDKVRHHLLLLAQNMTGYKNLLKLVSEAQLDGYYYRPRVDAEILAKYADGLICTSGCMAAEIPYLLNPEDGRPPQPKKALERLHWYLEVFGRERFFIELQEHNIPALTEVNKTLFEWGKKYDLQFLVTNDVHYVTAEDAKSHDTLLCVQTSALIAQQNRMRLTDTGYYLKSEQEMRDLFRPLVDLPDSAFTNSIRIADMCEVDLEDESFHLPDLPPQPIEIMPPHFQQSKDYAGFLRYLTEQGIQERYGEQAGSPEVQQRMEHELNIINKMGFAIYYLIVWDLCRFAREQNIWWNVRGSGAGSIVAYACGITLIDPLLHNLIFERFLNPGRISMPDFDLDYPDDQRERMIEYTRQRYGDDNVAQIVSFGRMKARAAIRDVGRAMDIPLAEVDTIAKTIAAIPGKPATIANALDPEHEFFSPELKTRYKTDARVKELVDSARSLEGVARHASVHAAAVIVTDRPLTEYVPVMRAQGSVITKSVTQFEFPVCESIGLLKVDFLGLSTLTVMRRAAELIKARHGLEFNLTNLPMDNPDAFARYPHYPPAEKAFELLASGNVTGVFQVEGSGMRRVLTEMKPTRFEHIVAAISLFRPGPLEYIPTYIARMHGREPVEFKHPRLEPILAETYGIIVYQEQIIRIAAELAGYAPGDADQIRKAVGKKIKAKIDEHRAKFVRGAVEQGLPQTTAEAIYGDIEFFARYGFNKAHAADYALVTCQTAYLKAHFPLEYMTALLTVERGNTDKVGLLMSECRAMGIDVLPPSVNSSQISEFVIDTAGGKGAERPAIRFCMSAVKNVGEGALQDIIAARDADGPFKDIDDFCSRVDLRKVGRRALENLIKVGALDDFASRHHLLAIIDRMINLSSSTHKASSVGQMSMFDMGDFEAPQLGSVLYPEPEDITPIPLREILAWEKELAGSYLSDHPIQRYMKEIKAANTTLLGDIDETMNGQPVTVAGLVNSLRPYQTKKGQPMAFVELEDIQAIREVVVFPRVWETTKALLQPGALIVVKGKVDGQGAAPKIIADQITTELTSYHAAEGAWSAASLGIRPPEPEPAPDELFLREAPAVYTAGPDEEAAESLLGPESLDRLAEEQLAPAAANEPAGTSANGYGNDSNGHHAKALGRPAPPSTTEPAPADLAPKRSAERHCLRITLTPTGNPARDKHRLRQIYHLLTEKPGNDDFIICIPNGPKEVRISFPNQTTHYTAHLEQKLVQIVGARSVQVE
jgi:DNA polymerase-3 subunit alpha